jgi:lysophospholipase L1-like esterase
VAIGLLALLELGVRGVMRLRDGSWPVSRQAQFEQGTRAALGLYRAHAFLNTAPREGATVEVFGKQASFNSLGYRSLERRLERPPGTARLVCLGGSATFDLQAASNDLAWPARLERLLSEGGPDTEVWNGGFPGWTSLETLIALALRDVDLDPDLMIVLQGLNDLQPGAHQPLDRHYERGHAEVARRTLGLEGPPTRALAWLRRSLLIEKTRELFLEPLDPSQHLQYSSTAPRLLQLDPGAGEVFERNLRSQLGIVQAHGARTVLVTQPLRLRKGHPGDLGYAAGWLPWLEPEAAPAALEELNEVTRRVAREQGLLLVDAARDVAWEDADFGDPFHFSAQGSERFARFLATALEESGWLSEDAVVLHSEH